MSSDSVLPEHSSSSGGGGKFKVQPRQAMIIVGAALVLLLVYRYYKNHYGSTTTADPATSGAVAGNGVDPTTGQAQANQPNPVPVINITNVTNPITPPPKPGPKPGPPHKPPVHKPPVHAPPIHHGPHPTRKPIHGGKGAGLTQAASRYSISSELVDDHSGLVASPSSPTPATGISSLNAGGGNF